MKIPPIYPKTKRFIGLKISPFLKMNNFKIITLNQKGITDFAMERNKLLKKEKSEWVLFLDSDETLSRPLKEEINNLQLTIYNKFSGFKIPRKNYFMGHYVGTDNILRLGKRNAGKWERRVHEIWKVKGKIGQLKNPIIHNSYKNLHEAIEKIDKYSTLHAAENLANGNRSSLFKIIIYPIGKFFTSLLIGRGLVLSMLQSFHSFLSWSKQWLSQKK